MTISRKPRFFYGLDMTVRDEKGGGDIVRFRSLKTRNKWLYQSGARSVLTADTVAKAQRGGNWGFKDTEDMAAWRRQEFIRVHGVVPTCHHGDGSRSTDWKADYKFDVVL